MVSTRHACAICGHPQVDLHHIEPWSICREHTFENLIALCPNHHRRAGNGEIDRKALLMYKAQQPLPHSSFADESVPSGIHRTVDLPILPEAYIAHPYVLSTAQQFVGRDTELSSLDSWIKNEPGFEHPVFAVTGIGGLGKSALTWKWFESISQPPLEGVEGCIWWSFYESDASFDNFVTRAVAYCSGASLRSIQELHPIDRVEKLLRILSQQRFLVVLDGLERLLIAYADAERSEEQFGRSTRAAYSRRVSRFLGALPLMRQSKVLLSSRLFPSDLESPTGKPKAGVFELPIGGLKQGDAEAFWRTFEIIGEDRRLNDVLAAIEYHPLCIRAIAAQICHDRNAPGDLSAWLTANSQRQILEARSPRDAMQYALGAALAPVSPSIREVLLSIAVLYMPAPYETLKALHVGPEKTFAEAMDLDDALSELEDRGLIGWDRKANRYDVHPIVRITVRTNSTSMSSRKSFEAIESHFAAYPVRRNQVASIDDLAPVISRYDALIQLGRFDDAYAVLCNSRYETGLYKFVPSAECARLLELMRPDGRHTLPKLKSAEAKSIVLCMLANAYYFAEDIQQSINVGYQRREIRIATGSNDVDPNLPFSLIVSGRHMDADAMTREYLAIAQSDGDVESEQRLLCFLALLAAYRADSELSNAALSKAMRTIRPRFSEGLTWVFAVQAECALLRNDANTAESFAATSVDSSRLCNDEGDRCEVSVTYAAALLRCGKIEEAATLLAATLELARRSNVAFIEARIASEQSLLALLQGDHDRARQLTEYSLSLSASTGELVQTVDTHLLRSRIEFESGNNEDGVRHAELARKLSIFDGSPYCYMPGIIQSSQLLGRSDDNDIPVAQSRIHLTEVDLST